MEKRYNIVKLDEALKEMGEIELFERWLQKKGFSIMEIPFNKTCLINIFHTMKPHELVSIKVFINSIYPEKYEVL
ncbi:Uncharacterised protein [Candidatus Anstonella stagnisolia]|nr:Uncharacterised protein [Candidatus Anstonella stagnisolia]